jgi:hypothetical protein
MLDLKQTKELKVEPVPTDVTLLPNQNKQALGTKGVHWYPFKVYDYRRHTWVKN